MTTFYCENCRRDFDIKDPQKKEYTDPVFGPCWKYEAECPECNALCTEKPKSKPLKKEKSTMPLYCQNSCPAGPDCCK